MGTVYIKHFCVSLLCVPVCVKEGQVCGNGTAYPGITCCTGLQCTGIHCNRPGGMEMSMEQVLDYILEIVQCGLSLSMMFRDHIVDKNLRNLPS